MRGGGGEVAICYIVGSGWWRRIEGVRARDHGCRLSGPTNITRVVDKLSSMF